MNELKFIKKYNKCYLTLDCYIRFIFMHEILGTYKHFICLAHRDFTALIHKYLLVNKMYIERK